MKIAICFGGRIHSPRSHIQLSPIQRSPSYLHHVPFLSLYVRTLSSLPLFYVYMSVFPIYFTLPCGSSLPSHTSHVLTSCSIFLPSVSYFFLLHGVTKYYVFSRYFTSLLPAVSCYFQLCISFFLYVFIKFFSLSLSCLFTPLFRAFSLPLSHTTLINLMTLHFRHCNAFSPPSRSSIPPMVRPIPHSLNHIIHCIYSFPFTRTHHCSSFLPFSFHTYL